MALRRVAGVEQGTRECSICWDKFGVPLNLKKRPCCGNVVCWRCLMGHIEGVLSDERPLRCPCCAVELTDLEVRAAINAATWYGAFWRTKAKLVRRWEGWSVGRGLRELVPEFEVLRCPGLDCENLFLVEASARKNKLRSEPQSYWNPLARRFLYSTPKLGSGDARRVYCNSCRRAFCSLCRRPWQQPMKGCRTQRPPMESHDFRSCVAFAGRSLATNDDFAAVGDAAGARACPSCSLRVQRSYGCNHIECPGCRQHWCFVCESPWSPDHYACRDAEGDTFKAPPAHCVLM
ncbi:hypothetical protein CTAYLR_009253 [Chrysophaeum taylorii]|uniref:RBR-type E3 ubiquitin transferase n=1 Tax=Chrysophaeum taylorii TaxID=2483200 RepID=A0AAD7XSK3_9STRA|nr:hypothetical protein CTAYLR_009253 [Chrysophaeum taylorii]